MEYVIASQDIYKLKLPYYKWAISITSLFCIILPVVDGVIKYGNLNWLSLSYIISFIIVFGILCAFIYIGGAKYVNSYLDYKLNINENDITLKVYGDPVIVINKNEIAYVLKNGNGLTIQSIHSDVINIPKQITNYMEIENNLKTWVTISPYYPASFFRRHFKKMAILCLILLSLNQLVHNKTFHFVNGAVIISLLLTTAILILKQLDLKVKKGAKLQTLLFFILIMVFVAQFVFSNT